MKILCTFAPHKAKRNFFINKLNKHEKSFIIWHSLYGFMFLQYY